MTGLYWLTSIAALYTQTALMAVYCALSIYGIRKWTREKGASHGKEDPD